MEIVRVPTIKEAIIHIMQADENLSKYRIAKDLNLSTSSHVNNFLVGETKKTRPEVMRLLLDKYGVLIADYENSAEYRRTQIKTEDKIDV